MTTEHVVDLYLAEVARLRSDACRDKYEDILNKFMLFVGEKTPFETLTHEQGEMFLSRYSGISPKTKKRYAPATQALHCSVLNGLFKFAMRRKYITTPVQEFERPKLPKPEDRDVVIVSTEGVKKMFQACYDWGDEICLGLLAYMGPRRNAVSVLRWQDVDLIPDPPHGPYGWIKLREKGGKIVEKPIPFVVRQILERAPEHSPEDYVVPSYRPWLITRTERKNDIIYRRVKNIAERAGVEAHVHSIRAAFAVFFLENHRGSIRSLQELLGHESIETTRHYTRALNRRQLTSEVVDMDWGTGALSEGERLSVPSVRDGHGVGMATGTVIPQPTPSLSALMPGGAKDGDLYGSGSADRPPGVSALVEGRGMVAQTPIEPPDPSSRADTGVTRIGSPAYPSPSTSASEMVSHDTEPESLSAQLPCGFEEAHTGFEPVLRRRTSICLGLAGTRHHLRHGTI